jgi:hypothetical protein
MAKYGRYDPRNKKNDRNKNRSLNRDIRIKESEKDVRKKKTVLVSWVEEDSDQYDENDVE